MGLYRSFPQLCESGRALSWICVGKTTGVQFDDRGLEGGGGIDLAWVGIEEKADKNIGLIEFLNHGAKRVDFGDGVEASFGGDFGTVFGDEANFGGLEAEGEVEHGGGGGHFEVELLAAFLAEAKDVVVLDMSAILSEVNGDRVRTGAEAEQGGGNGVGLRHDTRDGDAVPRLTKGGEVIDVDAKTNHTFILSQISSRVECF
jgi:hypothetical protein